MSTPKGYSSQEKEDRLSAQFQTVEPIREKQFGSSVVSHQFIYDVDANAHAEAGSTASVIKCTGHLARKGDVLYISSLDREVKVWETTSDTITLAETLPSAPSAGDLFVINRHKYPRVTSGGELLTTANEVATAGFGDPLPAKTKIVGGWDYSTGVYPVNVDAAGVVSAKVTESALPTGAATEATLATLATDATVATLATEATLSALDGKVTAVDTGNVTVSSSALPLGAATEATVSTLATEATLSTLATEATLGAVATDVATLAGTVAAGLVKVDLEKTAGTISTGNTSTATLGISASFVGAWEETTNFASIAVGVYSDQSSATDGFKIEFSKDGSTVHHTHTYTYLSSSSGTGYLFQPEFKYFRINYTNDGVAQTTFSLISILRQVPLFPSQYRISQAVTGESQALVTKGVIYGQTTGGGGGYVAVKVNPSGALTTEASVTSSVLPTGAATESTLSTLNTKVPSQGQAAMAASLPVVIASNQTGVPVTDNGGSLTVDGTVAATQSGTWNITNVSGTVSLPTGAATESTLSTLNGKVTACNTGAVTISTALPSGANTIGKVDVNTLSVVDLLDAGILDTSSTNIAGSASSPTQVVASLAAAVKKIQLLDTTGAFIGVYTGAAASEVLQFVMGPGSDQTIEHSIAASTRISLKRLDSTTAVSSGIVAINFIG